MKRVFVSYSRQDKLTAERLARDLDDAGFEAWIDFRSIQGGRRWEEEIFKGIENSEILVVCLSPASVASEWVRREILLGRSQHKFIIPVMLIDCLSELDRYAETSDLLQIQIISFENRYEQAFPELLKAMPGGSQIAPVTVTDIRSPFKGLEPFQQTDAHLFFGRDELIRKVLSELSRRDQARFLAVVGASGSGKSSLIRAGVIPALRSAALPSSAEWSLAIFTPGARPTESLAKRLLPIIGGSRLLPEVIAILEQNVTSLHQLVEGALAEASGAVRMLLVIDQFEEVFTRASESERERFLNLIQTAATIPDGRTIVIATMRADFFDRLSSYPALAALFQDNMVIATEMTPENLRQSIEGPAQVAGLRYDDGLTDRILEDVRHQPGSLPLMQYALTQLFEKREGDRLTLAGYEQIGGVRKALAQHAEAIYNRLSEPQKRIARLFLLRLVEVSDTGEATRRRVDRREITFPSILDDQVQTVIDLLTAPDARLLTSNREINASEAADSEPITLLEVSHEALIREWERYRDWVAENEEILRYGGELLKASHDWLRSGRDAAFLLTGSRLARAQEWRLRAESDMLANAQQIDFLDASIANQTRQQAARARQRAGLVMALFATLVVSALALFAVDQRRVAVEQAATAVAAQALAARALEEVRSLERADDALRIYHAGDPFLGLSLAMTLARQVAELPDPPISAQSALAEIGYESGIRAFEEFQGGGALSPDGHFILSDAPGQAPTLRDRATGEELRTFEGWFGMLEYSVAFSPDGRFAAGSDTDQVFVWNVDSGEIVQQLDWRAQTPVTFSSDGRHLLFTDCAEALDESDVCSQRTNVYILDVDLQGDSPAPREFWASAGIAALSPDGNTALVGLCPESREPCIPTYLTLYDVETQAIINSFTGSASGFSSVAFSPDGTTALSGGIDGSLILWDIESGDVLHTFLGHHGAVNSIVFSPDGLMVSTSSCVERWFMRRGFLCGQRQLIHWDVRHGALIGVFDEGADELSANGIMRQPLTDEQMDFSQGLARAFSGTRYSPGQEVEFAHMGVISVSGGCTMRVGEVDRGGRCINSDPIRFNNVQTGSPILPFPESDNPLVSGAANAFLIAESNLLAVSDANGTLVLIDIPSGTVLHQYEGHTGIVRSASLNPNRDLLISASDDTNLILWQYDSQKLIRRFRGHDDAVISSAFQEDGVRAASGSADGSIILWDVDSGEALRRFSVSTSPVEAVAFSPDGSVVSGDVDQKVALWRIDTLNALIQWVSDNRFVRLLTCAERDEFRIGDSCEPAPA